MVDPDFSNTHKEGVNRLFHQNFLKTPKGSSHSCFLLQNILKTPIKFRKVGSVNSQIYFSHVVFTDTKRDIGH